MTYDAVFLITSALKTTSTLSKYSTEDRFKQTIETIESIKKYGPTNSKLYLIDGSTEDPDDEQFQTIQNMGIEIFKAYEYPNVRTYAQRGYKIFIENLCLIYFCSWFKQNPVSAKRLYKISGRYTLTENFKLGYEHENAFVFLKSMESWMPVDQQNQADAKRFFETRLYHMDFSLFDTYAYELNNMVELSAKYGINVEHSIYKCLSKYNIVELEKIGVRGFISPSGEYKDD